MSILGEFMDQFERRKNHKKKKAAKKYTNPSSQYKLRTTSYEKISQKIKDLRKEPK